MAGGEFGENDDEAQDDHGDDGDEHDGVRFDMCFVFVSSFFLLCHLSCLSFSGCNPRWVPFWKAFTRRTQQQWTLRSLAALPLGPGRFQGVFRQRYFAVNGLV